MSIDYTDELFDDEALDKKSSYEEKSSDRGQDGLYRIDMTKVSPENKNRGYRAVLRFLPNVTNNPEYVKTFLGERWNEEATTALGPSHYEKITHFLNIQQESMKHLKGYYDCPTNVNPKTMKSYTTEKWGPFAKTFFQLDKSTNILMKEKAKMINYSKKYFSYVLIVEDEQQPELVGKIMIFSYGKQIKDIIESEKNGERTGIGCNIFKLNTGKDFVLLAKNKSFTNSSGKEVNAPEYTKSGFNSDNTSLQLPFPQENGPVKFKRVPLDDGKIKPEHQIKIREFLLSREHELESFCGKAWDEDKEAKVSEVIDYLTGKTSQSTSSSSSEIEDEVEDFSFDEVSTTSNPEDEKVATTSTATESTDFDDDMDDLEF